MESLLIVGAWSVAILAIVGVARIVIGIGIKIVRMHDNIMGDGNGRKPLRDIMEAHIEQDARNFKELNRHLNAQDVESDLSEARRDAR